MLKNFYITGDSLKILDEKSKMVYDQSQTALRIISWTFNTKTNDPIILKSFMNILFSDFKSVHLINVLYRVEIPICPASKLHMKLHPECMGTLHDCEQLNETCKCVCDGHDDEKNTQRYFYTGVVEPLKEGQ